MTTQPQTDHPPTHPSPRHHLIFNAMSGPGDPDEKLRAIAAALHTAFTPTLHRIESPTDMEALTRQVVAEGAEVVIAAGGDGTVSAIAAALVHRPTQLGIIPTGTANGFAHALGIPEHIPAACDIIKQGHGHPVDTARCNDRMMLLTTNIGFEANLLTKMDRSEKNRWGKLAIVVNSFRELREIERFETWLQTAEQTWHEPATAVTIANTATRSMVLAQGPGNITADDGNLAITVATPKRGWGMLASALRLFISALRQSSVQGDRIRSCKSPAVTVKTDPRQQVYVDGEPAGETPVTIRSEPRSLTVLVSEDTLRTRDESGR